MVPSACQDVIDRKTFSPPKALLAWLINLLGDWAKTFAVRAKIITTKNLILFIFPLLVEFVLKIRQFDLF
jgi:hypothetical protein